MLQAKRTGPMFSSRPFKKEWILGKSVSFHDLVKIGPAFFLLFAADDEKDDSKES